MSPALSERPSEERRTRAAVVGNDFTQCKGSGIHGDHTLRASARDEVGVLHLSRYTCMVWQPYDGDFFVERGYLDRIAHCIASGAHDWKPLATGCGRLIPGLVTNPFGDKHRDCKAQKCCAGNCNNRQCKETSPSSDAQSLHGRREIMLFIGKPMGRSIMISNTAGVTASKKKLDNNANCSARPPGHKRVKSIKMQHR